MSCRRIAGLFTILLLGAAAFKPIYTRSTAGNSTHNVVQLMMKAEQGTHQFLHDFKKRISDSPQGQHAQSFSPSQKTTNAAIPALGKSQRNKWKGALDYKITRIKIGRPLIAKRKGSSKSYSALTSSIVNNASGQDATKRLMLFVSNNLTNGLYLSATKGKI